VKRAAMLLLVAILCRAQYPRDVYREAWRAWREADPNLEREAVAGGPPIAQRADRMAAEAAKYAAARKSFLEDFARYQAQQVAWLENSALRPDLPALSTKSDTQFTAAETTALTRTIDTFATDPDRGIQQLRQALTRERAALDALGLAIAERRKSAEAELAAAQTIEQARIKALDPIRAMLEAAQEAPADAAREAAAWAEYYRKLGEGAKGEATPLTVVPPGVPTATLNSPVAAPPTITPVPLTRYVGSWSWPQSNGLYHGPQPEFIDVTVQEENGDAKGTVSARFKLPPGSTGDPVLRFDFSGKFQPTRNQVFDLVTTDGIKGTVDLIPGPAFNLLEVNFQTEPKPGKVRQADVVLVKK